MHLQCIHLALGVTHMCLNIAANNTAKCSDQVVNLAR